MKNILKYPIVIVFAVFIMGFTAIDILTPDKDFSDLENRVLESAPELTVDSLVSNEFAQDYETYTNDQFYLRDQWISLKSLGESSLGKIENNGIVFGDDGYMFDKLNDPDYERIEKNTVYYQEFIEKYPELNITVAFIPNSYTVLEDKVPTGLNNIDQEQYITDILTGLQGDNITKLDFTPTLSSYSDEYIYYRTDHHWTTLGAYYGYSQFVESVGMEPVPLNHLVPNIVSDFYGTYYNSAKKYDAQPDEMTWYDIPVSEIQVNYQPTAGLYDLDKFSIRDKYSAYLWGNNGFTTIKSDVNQYHVEGETSRIMVIKDSYANSMVPYLLYNYDEIHVVDLRHLVPKMSQIFAENSYDQVLLMYNFKNFAEDINLPKLRY